MSWLFDAADSSASFSALTKNLASNLQIARVQGSSDATEMLGVRSDTTQVLRVALVARLLTPALTALLWKSIKPRGALSLKPGEIKRVSDDLLVEKTVDGRIVLYEVVE